MKLRLSFALSCILFFSSSYLFPQTDTCKISDVTHKNSPEKQLKIYGTCVYRLAHDIVHASKSRKKAVRAKQVATDKRIKVILGAAQESGFRAKMVYKEAAEVAHEEHDKITELVLYFLSKDSVKTWFREHPIAALGAFASLAVLSTWGGKKLWDWLRTAETNLENNALRELECLQQNQNQQAQQSNRSVESNTNEVFERANEQEELSSNENESQSNQQNNNENDGSSGSEDPAVQAAKVVDQIFGTTTEIDQDSDEFNIDPDFEKFLTTNNPPESPNDDSITPQRKKSYTFSESDEEVAIPLEETKSDQLTEQDDQTTKKNWVKKQEEDKQHLKNIMDENLSSEKEQEVPFFKKTKATVSKPSKKSHKAKKQNRIRRKVSRTNLSSEEMRKGVFDERPKKK